MCWDSGQERNTKKLKQRSVLKLPGNLALGLVEVTFGPTITFKTEFHGCCNTKTKNSVKCLFR